ncbi:unnamed protein product [marine sediment metagenome]|uniref:Uncharacterized protein n=1 Tax=marine sediment metagenome TaxID=412755 RepID=X1K9A8_9ZZZZ
MKVRQVRKLINTTIELESEKEVKCLGYLLFCDVNPYASSIRKGHLELNGLDYEEDIRTFQGELRELLREED